MKIKNYTPSKGFIWTLLLVFFIAWVIYKCVPLTKEEQEGEIRLLMEAQNRRLAREFDAITDADRARLPKYDSRKFNLIKRNKRFWLVPKEYYGGNGLNVIWPDTVNDLLKRKWKNEFGPGAFFKIFMYSKQYYDDGDLNAFNHASCTSKMNRFKWNGILIRIYNAHFINITDEQYQDVCLTTLKILNEKIKELHFVN